jgi:hypothetical protein
VNSAVRAVYSSSNHELVSLEVNGTPVADEAVFRLVLQGYHAKNAKLYLDLEPEELTAHAPNRVLATSAQTVLKEWLAAHQNESRKVEGRLVYQP